MPTIKPLSEFNRNQSAVIKELHDSKLPMYLTRNGSAEIVVMDADAFDREVSYRASAYADEMRVYNSLMRGYRDVMDENVVSATEAEEALLQAKGLA